MPLLKKVGMLYGESGGTPFYQEFHYEPIFTWFEDHVFVANVVVIDPKQETMASSVISQPTGVTMKLSAIAKIHKYRRAPLYSNGHGGAQYT